MIAALRGSKVSDKDGDGASGEGLGLRGDQHCVIRTGVYFFSASALLPLSLSESLGSILGFHTGLEDRRAKLLCTY